MNIKEVEQRTGLPRSVIRFYEREGLIDPQRNALNSCREYAQEDVDRLIRIAFLRTLDIPNEDIRRVIAGKIRLGEAAGAQLDALCNKEKDVARAIRICERLESDAPERFDDLDVARYTGETESYVKQYRNALLEDCGRFALWFGSDACWMALVIAGTLLASIVFPKLPEMIPVQWNAGEVTASAPRGAIFAYPLAGVILRVLFGGRIAALCRNCLGVVGERIAPYAVNGLCLIALCLEAFTVLFLKGAASSVEMAILLAIAAVIAILALALRAGAVKK